MFNYIRIPFWLASVRSCKCAPDTFMAMSICCLRVLFIIAAEFADHIGAYKHGVFAAYRFHELTNA
jgi:hypothetical protein